MSFGYVGKFNGNESVLWKTEGATDMVALVSLGLPPDHAAVCNSNGAAERPAKHNEWFLDRFRGKEVFVVHDCDKPGQEGAVGEPGDKRPGWATALASYGATVRNVVLPYTIAENHGPDLRDWIGERLDEGKSGTDIYNELLEYARGFPAIERLANLAISDVENESAEVTARDGSDETPRPRPIEHPDDPHRLAEVNLQSYENEHAGHLRYWRQEWWKYREGVYRQISDSELSAKVTASIKREFDSIWEEENERYEEWLTSDSYDQRQDKGPPKVRPVKRPLVVNVIEAMKSLCLLSSQHTMPSWLDDKSEPNYVSLANGILSLDELFKPADERDDAKVILPHSPTWFSSTRLPYNFEADADCPRWKQFLVDVFNDDRESIEAIQKWFGYLLLPDTSLHKMMFVIGRPRSGKGTIMRTMISMLGRNSVASPTLNDLAGPFALQGLANKSIAVIGDARLSRRSDDVAITERILSITGEDPQDIHRKHLGTLHAVRMPLRFTLFSNQLPQLSDSSAAFMTRCIFVQMPNTYVGREDRSLGSKLEEELPGILNWAIAGRYELQKTGEIKQPQSGADIRDQMEIITAPVAFFLNSQCELRSDAEIAIQDLFEAWCEWCRQNDVTKNMDIQRFSKKLRDVVPNISSTRPRDGEERIRKFTGISLKKINYDQGF
jgi:putative DNA primase/helicase